MQQFIITHIDGQELSATITLGIDATKIVSTRAVGTACEFVYAETDDRRVKPIVYQVANHKSQVDALVTSTTHDLLVYDLALGTTSTLTVQEKFIEQVRESDYYIAQTSTACREVKFRKGTFTQEVVYVSNTLVGLATAVVTTTTTAATTTTTAAVTTTTTTGA